MQQNQMMTLLLGVHIVLLCHTGIALSNDDMSDADKKEVVYRMYAEYKKDFAAVEDISPQQAVELLKQERSYLSTRASRRKWPSRCCPLRSPSLNL